MVRFIKEMFNPDLKCERLGHDFEDKPVKIRVRSRMARVVVTDHDAKLKVCKRCRTIEGEPFDLIQVDWFTSCVMPNHMWDQIKKEGYLILEGG